MNNKNLSLINPFERIAGLKALIIGLIIYIATVVLGQINGIAYPGVISIKLASLPLLSALGIALSALIIFILILYIIGRLISKSRIRPVDVAGTLSLAKVPLLLVSLVGCIPTFTKSSIEVTNSLLSSITGNTSTASGTDYLIMSIFVIIIMVATIWMLILSYNAFSISCNVKGVKAIAGFIIAVVLTECICFAILLADFQGIL